MNITTFPRDIQKAMLIDTEAGLQRVHEALLRAAETSSPAYD